MKWEQRGDISSARAGSVTLLVVDKTATHKDQPFWWEFCISNVTFGLGSEDTLEEAKVRVEYVVGEFARDILGDL